MGESPPPPPTLGLTEAQAPDVATLSAFFLGVGAVLRQLCAADAEFTTSVNHSLGVVRKALDLFTPLGLAVSFNGGKDACTVLFLLMTVLAERGQLGLLCGGSGEEGRMLVICFDRDEFPAVQEFTNQLARLYSITMKHYPARCSYRDGMADLVTHHGIKAVLMGQRYGDPWTDGMEALSPSTPGWPPFTRVNPILRWPYGHVWRFLRQCGLPYCRLYDEGYTSLGEAVLTIKNPALRRADGSYEPAYELHDPALERSNRSPRVTSGPKMPNFSEPKTPDFSESPTARPQQQPEAAAQRGLAQRLHAAVASQPAAARRSAAARGGGRGLPWGQLGEWRRTLPVAVLVLAVVGVVQLRALRRG